MQRLHDPDGFRELERELRRSAEQARRTRESRSSTNGDLRDEVGPKEPAASIVELPVREAECLDCELEREETSA